MYPYLVTFLCSSASVSSKYNSLALYADYNSYEVCLTYPILCYCLENVSSNAMGPNLWDKFDHTDLLKFE